MSSRLIDGASFALYMFEQNKGGREEGYYALQAVKAFATEGEPMPVELIRYLNEACDEWVSNRNNYKSHRTSLGWEEKVAAAHVLIKCDQLTGVTRDARAEAVFKKVAEIYSERDGKPIKSETVKRNYNSSRHKEMKKNIDVSRAILSKYLEGVELKNELLIQLGIPVF